MRQERVDHRAVHPFLLPRLRADNVRGVAALRALQPEPGTLGSAPAAEEGHVRAVVLIDDHLGAVVGVPVWVLEVPHARRVRDAVGERGDGGEERVVERGVVRRRVLLITTPSPSTVVG